MNNDKQKLDLEGLLAEVEHAGRDARRRDELAAMVDSMAGTNRHGFWWWTVRVAAAACVLFFIGTAVRIWFIPTDSAVDDNLVAQAEVPELTPIVADTIPVAPAMPVRVQRHVVPTEVVEVEEYVAEEVPADTVAYSSPLAELGAPSPNLGEEPDSISNSSTKRGEGDRREAVVEEYDTKEPAPIVSVGNTPAAAPIDESKTKRESIFKNLFRRHEPSKMDGTMLALNIL